MTKSKIFLYFCLSFIFGIFIASFIKIPLNLLWFLLFFSAFLIFSLFYFFPKKNFFLIGFLIIFLILGISRYQMVSSKSENNKLLELNNFKEVNFTGIIVNDVVFSNKAQKFEFKPENINGKILIITNRYPEYHYGNKVKIIGKIEAPDENIEGFNYKDYLKKDGIYSIMRFPEIKLLEKNCGNKIKQTLFSFKKKFKNISQQFFSPPHQGILEALIFGDEENISNEWKEKLNNVGVRHITAVSGMNITVIIFLVFNFLLLIGFWRNTSYYLSIIIIILYILMIGMPVSGIRAAIMGILLITAQNLGRISSPLRSVVFAATFMLFLNPFLLKLDIGFQLSFLAILGLIYFQPIFLNLFKKIPDFKFFPIKTTLSATLSSQIFTLPILIYNFGRISLLSPIVNILIVPILSPLTILIFIFGFLGMISWILGYLFSFPVWLFLEYIVKIIDLFSKIPFTSFKIENVSYIYLIIFYFVLILFIIMENRKEKLKFLNY